MRADPFPELACRIRTAANGLNLPLLTLDEHTYPEEIEVIADQIAALEAVAQEIERYCRPLAPEQLRAIRRARLGMTLRQVEAVTGCHFAHLSAMERGEKPVPQWLAARVRELAEEVEAPQSA